MKDYIDKINNSKDATSVAQEPALAITVCQPKKSAEKRLEASMPCYFSEGELDEEMPLNVKLMLYSVDETFENRLEEAGSATSG